MTTPASHSGSPAVAANTGAGSLDEGVPRPVRSAAGWAWRLLLIAAVIVGVVCVGHRYAEVVVPVALAVLGCALLAPVVDVLDRYGVHRGVAVALTMLAFVAVLAGLVAFVVDQFIAGLPDITAQATTTVTSVKEWLTNGPVGLDQRQLDHIGDQAIGVLQRHQAAVTSGALATAARITTLATGGLLLLFLMIFFLYGGADIWRFVTTLVPVGNRDRVRMAGRAGFETLMGFVRATVIVAAVDAIGIGAGLVVMGVPLALPLAALVFMGAFIPIIGAFVTGALAVLVALVTHGWVTAVVVLAIVIAVQQIEAHVMQPLLLGRSVHIHPVAVVLGIAAGTATAGIVGALLAVPLIAFFNTVVRALITDRRRPAGLRHRRNAPFTPQLFSSSPTGTTAMANDHIESDDEPAREEVARSAQPSMVASREQLAVTTTNVAVGKARLEKYLVTEESTLTVTLAREEVRLVYDRTPTDDGHTAATHTAPQPYSAPSEETLNEGGRIVLYAQEPVITTRWVPVETARLAVHTVTQDQTHTNSVRVEKIGTQIGTELPPLPPVN